MDGLEVTEINFAYFIIGLGVVQFLTVIAYIAFMFFYKSELVERFGLTASLLHPNGWSIFALIYLIIIYYILRISRVRQNKLLYVLFTFYGILLVISLVLSRARQVYIVIFGILVLKYLFMDRHSSQAKLKIILTLVVILFFIYLVKKFSFFAEFFRLSEEYSVAMENRFILWKFSLKQLPHFLLLGVGPGSFKMLMVKNNFLVYGRFFTHPHNVYLCYFIENGILAGALFLVIQALIVRKIARCYKFLRFKPLFLAAFLAYLVLLIDYNFDCPIRYYSFLTFYFAILGVLLRSLRILPGGVRC
jgi:O-antigen ligase